MHLHTLVVAAIGGLVGAMVGFIGNWVTTSRQIARQERDKRREVYARLLADVEHFQIACSDFMESVDEYAFVHRDAASARPPHQIAYQAALKRLEEEHDKQADLMLELAASIGKQASSVFLFADDVIALICANAVGAMVHAATTYGDDEVRDALGYGNEDAATFSAEEAEELFEDAIRDIVELARADSRAPGASNHVVLRWKTKRRWDKKLASMPDIEGLLA